MHVKQAADAVRKKATRRDKGGTRKGGPTAMPPAWPRLALLPPPPQLPASSTSHYFTPSKVPPFHPRFDMPPLCPLPHLPDHPSATLLAHAVVCLLGNMLWLVYRGTLSFNRHMRTNTHFNGQKDLTSGIWTERERRGRKRVITSNKMVLYNPVMHIQLDMSTFRGNN